MRSLATGIAVSLTALAFTAMSDESSFYERLAQAGIAEVQAGKLAQSLGTSAEVRAFGAMMVEQHTGANEKLAALANSKGATLPTAPSEPQIDALKALLAQKGARFDHAYLAAQVRAHEEAAQLLRTEIDAGQDADTKAFAEEMLPTVESHLRMANQLIGQETKAAALPPREQ